MASYSWRPTRARARQSSRAYVSLPPEMPGTSVSRQSETRVTSAPRSARTSARRWQPLADDDAGAPISSGTRRPARGALRAAATPAAARSPTRRGREPGESGRLRAAATTAARPVAWPTARSSSRRSGAACATTTHRESARSAQHARRRRSSAVRGSDHDAQARPPRRRGRAPGAIANQPEPPPASVTSVCVKSPSRQRSSHSPTPRPGSARGSASVAPTIATHGRRRERCGRHRHRSKRSRDAEREERQRRDQEPRPGHPAAERERSTSCCRRRNAADDAERQDRLAPGVPALASATRPPIACRRRAASGRGFPCPTPEARAAARRLGNVRPKSPSSFAPITS